MPKVTKKRKNKSGKEHTGKGNLGDETHMRQRIKTQMIDENSQSDVTVQELEELSRSPKRTKTVHLLGHCQKVCKEGVTLQGTTVVAFFVPALQSRGWGTHKKPLPKNWPGREKAYFHFCMFFSLKILSFLYVFFFENNFFNLN